MSSSSEDDSLSLGDLREDRTVGHARRTRLGKSVSTQSEYLYGHKTSTRSRSGASDRGDTTESPASATNGVNKNRGHSSSRVVGSRTGRTNTTTRQSSSSRAKGRGKGKALGAATKRGGKGKGKPNSKGKKRTRLGILGVPSIGSWDPDDCDYDDSDDETYLPVFAADEEVSSLNVGATDVASSGTPSRGRRRAATRSSQRLRALSGENGELERESTSREVTVSASSSARDLIEILPPDLLLKGVIRPYLDPKSKCGLQRTCRQTRQMINDPSAWDYLDLRGEVIGTRTMRSGRRSLLSHQPMFFLARSMVVQPRFGSVTTVDLRRMNLGAMGSPPDLLLKLFDNCRHITSLNLWGTYFEHEGLPQPDSEVEKAISEHLPGVQHLALDMVGTNRGLTVLLKGCQQLRSLHIGSRGRRMTSSRPINGSMYPNDIGMKAFATYGAPCLETLSIFDKSNLGQVGLSYILDSCPQLKNLLLVRIDHVRDSCLKAVAQRMNTVTSLTLDELDIDFDTVTYLARTCSKLRHLAVATTPKVLDVSSDLEAFYRGMSGTPLGKLGVFTLEIYSRAHEKEWWLKRPLMQEFALTHGIRLMPQASIPEVRIAPFMRCSLGDAS